MDLIKKLYVNSFTSRTNDFHPFTNRCFEGACRYSVGLLDDDSDDPL